jgi:putative MATE family efflux protein
MDRSRRLGDEKIGKLLWTFALPAISSMLINALYGVVDRIFVGRGVGSIAIAGVMVGFPVMMAMMALGMLIGIGASNAVSIYLGQKKKEEAERTVGNSLFLFLVLSVVITVLGLIFLKPLLVAFGSSPEVTPYAEKFVRIILIGFVFQCIGFGMNNLIRAEGNPLYSMITQMTGAVLNIILCYVFIFVLKFGIEGSAIATVISQGVTSLMVLGYFYTKQSALHIHLRSLRPDAAIIKRILSIGLAPFSMQFTMAILFTILNHQLVRYGGDMALSAWGAINSVLMLFLMPIFGLNQGAQPIVGYKYGAKNCLRVRQTLMLTIRNSTIIVGIGFLVIQVFAGQIISLFAGNDPALVAMGSRGMRIFLAMLPIVGFQIAGANYFQFIGKPKHSMFLGLSRQILLLIPAVLILPLFFGLDGVWLAGAVSDGLSAVITGYFVLRELRKLKDLERCAEASA